MDFGNESYARAVARRYGINEGKELRIKSSDLFSLNPLKKYNQRTKIYRNFNDINLESKHALNGSVLLVGSVLVYLSIASSAVYGIYKGLELLAK